MLKKFLISYIGFGLVMLAVAASALDGGRLMFGFFPFWVLFLVAVLLRRKLLEKTSHPELLGFFAVILCALAGPVIVNRVQYLFP